ncbi:MAG: hypothetical protein ACUVWK_02265 [Nitrososphaerales archaeon]
MEELRKRARTVDSLAHSLENRQRYISEVKIETGSIRRPIRRTTNVSSLNKAMMGIGVALIMSPDPFSDLPGMALIAIGRAMGRFHSSNSIKDALPEFDRMLRGVTESDISKFRVCNLPS